MWGHGDDGRIVVRKVSKTQRTGIIVFYATDAFAALQWAQQANRRKRTGRRWIEMIGQSAVQTVSSLKKTPPHHTSGVG